MTIIREQKTAALSNSINNIIKPNFYYLLLLECGDKGRRDGGGGWWCGGK